MTSWSRLGTARGPATTSWRRLGTARGPATTSLSHLGTTRGRATTSSRRLTWPFTVLLIGYPLWWAMGIADFMWIVVAVPMVLRMAGWRVHRTRRLRLPPGFGLWLLFLIGALAGAAVLNVTAPGTVPSPVSARILSYVYRLASYLALTVLLLYAGNLTEEELPRRRLAWMLGMVAIFTTVGGLAGMVEPRLQFSSPAELLLPARLQSNAFVHAVTHPGLAQLQNVLGGSANARPKAPFDYTNTWAECLTLLMPWLVVTYWYGAGRRRGLVALTVVAGSAALLYSLNRGAWIGAVLSACAVAIWVAGGKPRATVRAVAAIGLAAVVVAVATPVPGIVSARLSRGGSSRLRGALAGLALTDAASSPIIGYGDTRKQRGSQNRISAGPTQKCPICGEQEVGSTGQLFLLLVCNGIAGAALFVGFFIAGLRRFAGDRTPYGRAGILVLVLSLLYLFFYDAVPAPLGFTLLAYALLWRNDQLRARIGSLATPLARPAGAVGTVPGA